MKNKYCDETVAVEFRPVSIALMVMLWVATGLSQAPANSAESSPTGQPDPWQKYDIILQRNIFSRQRAPARPRGETKEPKQVAIPNPESYFLLKGVVQENDTFIAFVENTQGGGVLRLRAGDPVARGTIKALNLDSIEYQLGDQTIAIKLGCDLEGRYGTVTAGELPDLSELPALAVPQPQPAQTPLPSGDEAEILKRLMEQRKQQLGQ
jgi:hypothetical protein